MPRTAELAAADRRHLWHPFTQQQGWCEADSPPIIDHADASTLYDTEGNAYIDGVSSLWCNVHGHRHPAIDAAITEQLGRVAHSTMLGLSHEPGITLAERLVAIAPPGLTRVFYSDSGSTAVEVALKMAFQSWAQRGEPERTALHLSGERLPRRHARSRVGRRHRAVPLALPPVALRLLAGPGRRRRSPRRAAARASRASRRDDRRAARTGRGRDADGARRATCAACASCATATACC